MEITNMHELCQQLGVDDVREKHNINLTAKSNANSYTLNIHYKRLEMSCYLDEKTGEIIIRYIPLNVVMF